MKLASILIAFFLLSCAEQTKTTDEEKSEGKDAKEVPFTSFERPPFLAIGTLNGQNIKFGLIGTHSKPEAAVSEANWLDDVWEYLSALHEIDDGIILGDLNLACDYASQKELDALDLRTSQKFKWLIPDSADTNVAESHCAYDRIISVGDLFIESPEGSVDEEVIKFSDHKPVNAILAGLKFGSFNAKVFGETKSNSAENVAEVAKIICKNDVTLIVEIVAQTPGPAEILLSEVNKLCGPNFELKLSDPTGTTDYKERFAYYFNNGKINLTATGLFPQQNASMQPENIAPTPETAQTQPSTPAPDQGPTPTPVTTPTTPAISCGSNPYKTPGGYCYATKNGAKKRVANSCCGL